MNNVYTLSLARFDALACGTRWADSEMTAEELEWYAAAGERVIGAVLRDTTDGDFGYVVLGRDETGLFRAVDIRASIPNPGMARSRLKAKLQEFSFKMKTVFPQGVDGTRAPDIFKPVVPEDRLHEDFRTLMGRPNFSPARGIMQELMCHFQDVDGNFLDQFQSVGFDARIWELYLYAYLKEERLHVDRTHHAPDFMIEKYGYSAVIEAVVVGPSPETAAIEQKEKDTHSAEGIRELLSDYMPIKFGGPLARKLNKKPAYWDLPHAKDKPLVFAIADFHDKQSMLWSSTALIEYLYGARHDFHFDEDGTLVISPLKIESHRVGKKEIPSGFFFQPGAENLSAVLFSASGTISKFNRMGRLAGFGVKNLEMVQIGTYYDHDPNAALPKLFERVIAPGSCSETWGEGVTMYHNPKALRPVPTFLFPSISHLYFSNGLISGTVPKFQPFSSVTLNALLTTGEKSPSGGGGIVSASEGEGSIN